MHDARFLLRSWCGRHPLILKIVGWLRGFGSEVCSGDTDLVVEAYPRCANTYTVAAFKILFGEEVRIARHRHASAQFKMAAKLDKASILIIRNPLDAISSLAIRRPEVSVSLLIKEYISFHKDVLDILQKRKNIKVLMFEDVTGSPSTLMAVAKRLPGLSVVDSIPSENEFSRAVFEMVEEMEKKDSGGKVRESHVARPSLERQSIKEPIVKVVLANQSLFRAAENVYRQVALYVSRV